MQTLPLYVAGLFGATVLTALYLIVKASGFSKPFLSILSGWILFQSVLSLAGFYTGNNPVPPRFPFLILPPVIFIMILLSTRKGRCFIDAFDMRTMTLLHVIRIPVEIVLYWLFLNKAIPELMTFEGRNFDIVSGLTAPVFYYLFFVSETVGRRTLIAWNLVCLALLVNVVVNSVLSAPTPFQQFAFDQPNIAISYFPFVLLPSFLVPMVVLSHVSSLRQLFKQSIK